MASRLLSVDSIPVILRESPPKSRTKTEQAGSTKADVKSKHFSVLGRHVKSFPPKSVV
jgi:hypothetical protein